MGRRTVKKFVLATLALTLALGWVIAVLPGRVAADAPNSVQQTVIDQQICPALKNIKKENLSNKYCVDYTNQKSMDDAEKKICGKYKTQLKSQCAAYASAKGAAGGTALSCEAGDATCSTCGGNPNASGCPCANNNPACSDNATTCDFNGCDLIRKYINPAIDLASVSFGLIAAGSLILAGINYTTSEGDPQKSSSAKNRMSKTIVALIAYIFLYAFLQFIIPGGAFNR